MPLNQLKQLQVEIVIQDHGFKLPSRYKCIKPQGVLEFIPGAWGTRTKC